MGRPPQSLSEALPVGPPDEDWSRATVEVESPDEDWSLATAEVGSIDEGWSLMATEAANLPAPSKLFLPFYDQREPQVWSNISPQ